MNPLRRALSEYLSLRRALGYKLVRTEKLLNQFLAYLEKDGAEIVTIEAALNWARRCTDGAVNWQAHRLSVVRGFASHLHVRDVRNEIPSTDLLPSGPHRANPYLYSDEDIAALLAATASLKTPLRRITFRTLIALLAVTGMRIGEAIRLNRNDIDFRNGLLRVLLSKFGKSRELVVHPTALRALADYLRQRKRLSPSPSTAAVFTSSAGTRLLYCNVQWTFHRLVRLAGLSPRSASCRPRIHDLRHSFAVRSLLDAYAAGKDGQTTLTLLSTYLGHVNPACTYWYLSASPELLAFAAQRLELHLGGRP